MVMIDRKLGGNEVVGYAHSSRNPVKKEMVLHPNEIQK